MAARKRPRSAVFAKPVPADDVVVACIRLGDTIVARLTPLAASHGLTLLQYNVLRILYVRDAEGTGLPIGTVGAGLLVHAPDVTRLVDRLEQGGLVERFRSLEDRRAVNVRLTDKGIALVERFHPTLVEHNRKMLSAIPDAELRHLAQNLSRALSALI